MLGKFVDQDCLSGSCGHLFSFDLCVGELEGSIMYSLIALSWFGGRSVGIELPTIEVRYENLSVDADCYVGSRALPTLWNSARNFAEVVSTFTSHCHHPHNHFVKIKNPILTTSFEPLFPVLKQELISAKKMLLLQGIQDPCPLRASIC